MRWKNKALGYNPASVFSRLCDLESIIWALEASLLSPIIRG